LVFWVAFNVLILKLNPQHRFIPALPTWKESAFAGFFGPIGVGAVFYVQVALERLPEDRERLRA
jgi:NhaP-type Na+/H+ or K+/H+ antiporter